MKKNTIDCLVESYQFYTLSAQTTPEKTPEKTELNEVTIIKTKKSDRAKADRTIFNFADQPNLNTGSVLKGSKNYLV
jgi:hypothetical protein